MNLFDKQQRLQQAINELSAVKGSNEPERLPVYGALISSEPGDEAIGNIGVTLNQVGPAEIRVFSPIPKMPCALPAGRALALSGHSLSSC